VAVQRWGQPRLTEDVDRTILTGFGGEEPYIDALLDRFRARREDARDFALQFRVVLLESGEGIPLDVALGAMPFEARAVDRSSSFALPGGASLRTCSAEDLIVFKTFAGRAKDWLDVEGIILRQRTKLDTALIWDELTPLLELKMRRRTPRVSGVCWHDIENLMTLTPGGSPLIKNVARGRPSCRLV